MVVPALDFSVVKHQAVIIDEKIDCEVGRRARRLDALSTTTSNKANAIAWRKAFGGVRIPRGVHRIKTHHEADEWLWRMISRPKAS